MWVLVATIVSVGVQVTVFVNWVVLTGVKVRVVEDVAVSVADEVGEVVSVWVAVMLGVIVSVAVMEAVGVKVRVAVAVLAGVEVRVGVLVEMGVRVMVKVLVGLEGAVGAEPLPPPPQEMAVTAVRKAPIYRRNRFG